MYNGITLDGTLYRVRIKYNTLEQSFSLLEGPNAGEMLSGRRERDLVGTRYAYQLAVEPDPKYPADYDSFFWAISAPVDAHTVALPSRQGTMSFSAMVHSGGHVSQGTLAGVQRWSGLVVNFEPIEPQRIVE